MRYQINMTRFGTSLLKIMGFTLFLLFLGSASFAFSQDDPLPAIEISPDTKAIFPIEDAYISDQSTSQNFGSSQTMMVGYDSTQGYVRSLLLFDIAGELPTGAVIESAALEVYVFSSTPAVDAPLVADLYQLDSPWNEILVRWNNQPALGAQRASNTLGRDPNFYSWDVTALVQDWVDGSVSNNGMIIIADGSPLQVRSRQFYAREKGGGLFPPRLTISFDTDSVAPQSRIETLPDFSPTSFTVRWCGVDEAGGSGLQHYDVQYRADEGSWTDWQTDTTAKSAAFSGTAGVTYDFRARAVDNANNESAYTADTAARTAAGVPFAVMNSFAETITDQTTVNISWTSTANGVTVDGYDIYYRYNDGIWIQFINDAAVTSGSFTAANGDGVYQFEAVAVSSAGSAETAVGTAEAAYVLDQAPFSAAAIYLPALNKASEETICDF